MAAFVRLKSSSRSCRPRAGAVPVGPGDLERERLVERLAAAEPGERVEARRRCRLAPPLRHLIAASGVVGDRLQQLEALPVTGGSSL